MTDTDENATTDRNDDERMSHEEAERLRVEQAAREAALAARGGPFRGLTGSATIPGI